MVGTRSNFEKWEPNVAARLISMSSCGWRLQKSHLRPHRGNAKTAKSVALKADTKVDRVLRRRCQKFDAEAKYNANALRTTRSDLEPINSRTYFTGGLPYEITWSLYFLRLNWSPRFFCSAARRSRCSVAPTK